MAVNSENRFKRIATEMRGELDNLGQLYAEWKGVDAGTGTPSVFLRGKASIFHDFYCGVERLFKHIADELNGGIPAGESWHHTLLNDMKLAIPGLRPRVITDEIYRLLIEFLSFRHKFRNIYGFALELHKLENIEKNSPKLMKNSHVT